MSKRIAVIGSGISGLVSASLLSQENDITLFEANNYLGGHTRTVDVKLGTQQYALDTGFVVFNKQTYPNFCQLIDKHQIPITPSEMSFSFRSDTHDMEYNGNNLNTLFADRGNFIRPAFYRFIKDILRFNHSAKKYVASTDADCSLKEFIQKGQYSDVFLTAYLIPIVASIWTKNNNDVWQCPARFLLEFFSKHGLLNIINRPQWYTIAGGSRNYIPALTKNFQKNIHLNTKIERVERQNNSVILKTKDAQIEFDAVVIAVHSDQALAMLAAPTANEKKILGAIPYTQNEAILHTDSSLLPKKRLAWASWNYYDIGSHQPTLTYYLNRLQNFTAPDDFCLSVNLPTKVAPEKIIQRFSYAHPLFTEQGLKAQKQLHKINGKANTFYCGAYWGYGFHEDGVKSGLEVARLFESLR